MAVQREALTSRVQSSEHSRAAEISLCADGHILHRDQHCSVPAQASGDAILFFLKLAYVNGSFGV